jgi:hypothetical protein
MTGDRSHPLGAKLLHLHAVFHEFPLALLEGLPEP